MESLSTCKIADVIGTEEFSVSMARIISRVSRKYMELVGHGQVKRCAYNSLRERNVWNAAKMIELYESAMNKRLNGYSATERAFIVEVGNKAFTETMQKFIDEEAKHTGHRND